MKTLDRLYRGKKIFQDYWPQYLAEYEAITNSNLYDECRKWYEERYNPADYSTYPLPDFPEGQYPNAQGTITHKLDIDAGRIKTTRYEFFNAAALLAIAAYNNNPNVMLSWTDNNRQDKSFLHTVGALIRDLPIAVRLDGMTIGGLFGSVNEQMKLCAEHSCYPYIPIHAMLDDDLVCSIYQGRLYETPKYIKIFDGEVPVNRNSSGLSNILDIEIEEPDDGFEVLIYYAAHRYRQDSMKRFAEIYVRIVHCLIDADPDTDAVRFLEV